MTMFLRSIVVALGLTLTATLIPATTGADEPVRPHQRFAGLVNDAHENSVVYVACGGPVWDDRRTHPLEGQTLAVQRAITGEGLTGAAGTRIVARFLDDTSARVKFTSYGVPREVPTTILVPCEGTGIVRFAPRPPSSTSRPDFVRVAYVNLAD